MGKGRQFEKFMVRCLSGIAVLWLTDLPAFGSAGPLPVGLPPEDALSWVLLRAIVLVGALFFLFLGARFHRFLFSTYFLLLGSAVLFLKLATYSYLIALGGILILYILLSAIHLVWPRLTTGLATIWILPALYIYFMMDSGSFEWSRLLMMGLAAFGLVFGLAFPRVSRIPISVALGIVFLVFSSPIELSFLPVMAAAAGGLLVQSVDFFAVRRVHHEWMDTWKQRMENWKGYLGTALLTGVTVTGVLVMIVWSATPVVNIGQLSETHMERVRTALEKDGTVEPTLLTSAADVYYLSGRSWPLALFGQGNGFNTRLTALVRGRHTGSRLRQARVCKEEAELAAMREAARITSVAMAQVGEMVRPGISERDIAERIEDVFRREGADAYAFRSIVGSGPNACLPHYQRNNAVLESGFVVVDIGCMVDGYCSDMTRTFPVHRTYSPAQLELAELVMRAKEKAQSMVKPGVDYRDVDQAVRDIFREAGMDAYYLHTVGHHVGISVHDPMVRKLEAGMVVTIEPGLYIAEEAPIESRYWNLGIRIEDTILVTETGFESLTDYDQLPFLTKVEESAETHITQAGKQAGGTYD